MMSTTKSKLPHKAEITPLNADQTLVFNGTTAPTECNLGCGPERGTYQTPDQCQDACEEAIRELAYQKWEAAGCPSGDGFDFWIEAEYEVMDQTTHKDWSQNS